MLRERKDPQATNYEYTMEAANIYYQCCKH